MTWIINIIVAILRALVPTLFKQFKQSRPTCEDARRQPELKGRLKDRIRKSGWNKTVLVVIVLLILPGCFGSRTVYVPSGEPVRLRETIKNAKIWTLGKDGKPVAGKMDLPEGWYCLEDTEP